MKDNHKKYYKTIKKKTLKSQVKLIIGLILLVLFLIPSVYFGIKYIQYPKYQEISYKEDNDLDYKVFLKDNNYFDTPYLEKGSEYVASLIDYLDLTFHYDFSSSIPVNYEYTYYIDADVNAYEKGSPSKTLYDKTERILEPVTESKDNASAIYVDPNIQVDYVKYNDVITNFKKDYLLSLESNLKITLTVEMKISSPLLAEEVTRSKNINVTVPLSEQTVDVNIDYDKVSDENTLKGLANTSTSKKYLCYAVVFGLLALCTLIYTIIVFVKSHINRSKYHKVLDKILKEYDKVIVMANNVPDLDNYNIIEVNSFSELLDARDTLDCNIVYVELIHNHRALFLILHDNLAYMFLLSDDGEVHGKK